MRKSFEKTNSEPPGRNRIKAAEIIRTNVMQPNYIFSSIFLKDIIMSSNE